MSNVGYATLTVIPSAKGFASALGSQTAPIMRNQGSEGGRRFGGAMLAGLGPALAPMAALFGAAKIAGFMRESIAAASDLGESVNALNVVFGDASAGIQEIGQSAARNLGLSTLDFNNLAVRFSNFAKTVAGDGGDVVGTMRDLTGRATDFASVMNLDVNEAAQIFQSSLAGETEPIRRFGIDLSAAAVQAYAYANGIAASGSTLTEAQKVQARYGLLMQQTAQVQGDFANTSGGLANQQRILSAGWTDLTAKIGTLFLPGATGVVSFLNSAAIPALSRMVDAVAGVVGAFQSGDPSALANSLGIAPDSPLFGAFQAIADGARAILPQIMEGLAPVGEAFQSLLPVILQLVPTVLQVASSFSPLHLILQALLPVLPQIAGVIGNLLSSLLSAVGPLLPVLADLAGTIVGALGQALQILLPILADVATLLAGALGQAFAALAPVVAEIASVLGDVLGTVLAAIAPLLEVLAQVVAAILPPVLSLISPILSIVSAFLPLVGIVGDLIGSLLPPLIGIIMAILPPVAELVGTLAGALAPILELVADLIGNVLAPVLSTVIGWVASLLTWVLELAGPVLGFLVEVLANVIGWVANVIASFVEWIGNLGSAGEAIGQMASAVWDGILRVVGFFRDLPGRVLAALGNLGRTLLGAGSDLLSGLRSGAENGFSAVAGFVGSIPSRVLSALGSVGTLLYQAGKNILQGFLDGLTAGFTAVRNFVGGIGSWIANHKGPKDYDLALLVPAGRWIMTGLRAGLEGEIPALLGTLDHVSDAVRGANFGAPDVASGGLIAAAGAAGSAPVSVVIRVDDERLSGVFQAEIQRADASTARAVRYGRR